MGSLNSRELYAALWAAADAMRDRMSADDYKHYLLTLVFFKALSDKFLSRAASLLSEGRPLNPCTALTLYRHLRERHDATGEQLATRLRTEFSCLLEPEQTFSAFAVQCAGGCFQPEQLKIALTQIENSQGSTYTGMFADFDINSVELGRNPEERAALLSEVILALSRIDFSDYEDDALGDAYEYLIEKFASESGRKAGEFYTPQAVSQLLSRLVISGHHGTGEFSLYDPCCGSGSLLLQAGGCLPGAGPAACPFHGSDQGHLTYFGQENNHQTFNLARMNMLLHQVPADRQHLRCADTLAEDWPEGELFDAVVMNPPYSQKWSPNPDRRSDPRFRDYAKLPPRTSADFAFLLHGFYHLKEDGCMGIVLPHGVLFRSHAEAVIRRQLLENGSISTIIGLPPHLFYSTSIPACILILTKHNPARSILFIDASADFVKTRARNLLEKEQINKIFEACRKRRDIPGYAHLASYEEIEVNDFNLNVPRYVIPPDADEGMNPEEILHRLEQLEQEEHELDARLKAYFRELKPATTTRQKNNPQIKKTD